MDSRTPATHYEFSGEGLSGTVDLAGLDGRPVLAVQVDGRDVADLELGTGAAGHVVTGQVEYVPDLRTVRLQLVLPEANVGDEPVQVDGVGLVIARRTSIGGPGLVRGVLQEYRVVAVTGTASAVQS